MVDKYYTSEEIHELITKYNTKIIKLINDNKSEGNGLAIYEEYSKLPTDLTENSIAYCKNDKNNSDE